MHIEAEFLPCSRGFVIRIVYGSMWSSLNCTDVPNRKLPMTAYGPGKPENPDFPIKIEILYNSTCDALFQDLLAYFERTHAKTYEYTR